MERKERTLLMSLGSRYWRINFKAINHEIRSKQFQNCQVFVSNVDSQASASGGVVVQVLGELSNNNDACHKFCQTFFLAEQPEGYYVLNDIFRFLKEELELADGEKTPGDRSAPPVFNFQEPKPVAAAPAAPVAAVKMEKVVVQEKTKPVIQKAAPNGVVAPNPVPSKADTPKPAAQAQVQAKPKTAQPVKQTQPTPTQQSAAKPTTAPEVANVNGASSSPAPATIAPVATVPASNSTTQAVEKKSPVEKRPASPVKKPAPASWSKVVASAEAAVAPSTQTQAPTKPVLVKAAAKEKKPAAVQGQQAKKPEENADGFQDVPTRHRNLDRTKSNDGN
jgi:Nuclear transport factor 2 (NTF2) domain